MRDLPFVPFFTGDWLASSARVDMSLAERAVYLDLLFQLWERGGAIPSDPAKLAKMAMVTPAEFESAWPRSLEVLRSASRPAGHVDQRKNARRDPETGERT
jgi:hypothetical protein